MSCPVSAHTARPSFLSFAHFLFTCHSNGFCFPVGGTRHAFFLSFTLSLDPRDLWPGVLSPCCSQSLEHRDYFWIISWSFKVPMMSLPFKTFRKFQRDERQAREVMSLWPEYWSRRMGREWGEVKEKCIQTEGDEARSKDLGVEFHTCNPRTQEITAGRSGVQSQFQT